MNIEILISKFNGNHRWVYFRYTMWLTTLIGLYMSSQISQCLDGTGHDHLNNERDKKGQCMKCSGS